MIVSRNRFILPITFNGLNATAYLEITFNYTAGNYSFSLLRKITIGNLSPYRLYKLHPLNPTNQSVFLNETGSCKEFQLQTDIQPISVPFAQLTVSFEDFKIQIFKTNTNDSIVVDNNLTGLQFSNKSVDICPQPGNNEIKNCYVFKLEAKSEANFVTSGGSSSNFSGNLTSYTFSNCSVGPSFLTFEKLENSTIFHIPVEFNASRGLKNPRVVIDFHFNHSSEKYFIGKAVGHKFDTRNKTLALFSQNPSSNVTLVPLNETGICDSYRLQSKLVKGSPRQLTVIFENLKFEVFRTTVKDFNVVANSGFSTKNVTICTKSGGSGVTSNIGVVLGIALLMLASKFIY